LHMAGMVKLFGIKKPVIAMIHVDALPGTPKSNNDVRAIVDKACKEALIYQKANVDVIAIENMHDVPYLNCRVGPEITSAMAVIGYEIKRVSQMICGLQILAGANNEALAVAHAAGLDFIRAEGFVFSHVADEGLMNSCAGELLRYRKQIGAEKVLVFTDIKKKHSSHSITSDVSIEETAKAAEYFLSDGVIVTGTSTGEEASMEEIQSTKKAISIPVMVGSGVTIENVESYLHAADGLIVGSYFKSNGNWKNGVDFNRVETFMRRVVELRNKV